MIKCDRIHPTEPYEYSVNSGSNRSIATTTIAFTVAAGSTVTIKVRARNSAGKLSQPADIQVKGPKAG